MHLMCRSIDARELSNLVGEIVRENIVLFRRDSFPTLLSSSLSWETIEQMILWQFIRAESVPIDIIPTLHYTKHSETCINVLLMLKSMDHEPNITIMRNLMCRPYKDLFVVHALKVLIDDDDNLIKVAQLLNTLLKKSISANEIMNSSFNQTQPKQKSKRSVTVDNIFAHLDQFRLNCLTKESRKAETFLSNSSLQEMFTMTRRDAKLADVRTKYSELYAVMEIFSEEGISTRGHRKIGIKRGKRGHHCHNIEVSQAKAIKMKGFELEPGTFFMCTEASPRCFVIQQVNDVDNALKGVQTNSGNTGSEQADGKKDSGPPSLPMLPWCFEAAATGIERVSTPDPNLQMNAEQVKARLKSQLECQMDSDQFVPSK
uniref:Ints3-like C-terminal domain-containing protein n=1 Tax=Ditylenchus dipsaci TaxID=166011 RepID=A0A915DG13_9BILA